MMQTIVITGATAGIGRELTFFYAQHQNRIIAIGRSDSKLAMLQSEVQQATGHQIETFCIDLIDPTLLKERLATEEIDLFINNAGVSFVGDLMTLEDQQELHIVQLNFVTPFLLTKWVAKQMIAAKKGIIVNVCSTSSFLFIPCLNMYSAMKRSLFAYSIALQREVSSYCPAVRIIAVCPGPTKTDLVEQQIDRFSTIGQRLLHYQMSTAYVVQKIDQAIKRKKSYLIIGWLDRIAIFILNALPITTHSQIMKLVSRWLTTNKRGAK